MPELAEVEFYRKQWDAGLAQTITAVAVHARKRIFRGTDMRALARVLTGRKLLNSETRGKQMLFRFSGGAALGLHLGMTGHLRVEPANFTPAQHDHLVLRQAKRALVFRDPRQFGRVRFHAGPGDPDWWENAAPPIASAAFSIRFVREFLQRHRRAPLKAVLLHQGGFAGVGNWMADEILWRAKLSPRRLAGALHDEQIGRLRRQTRFVARAALRVIGHDFSDPPKSWLIHQRWKTSGVCPLHRTPLQRAQIGGRTTAWCPTCQK